MRAHYHCKTSWIYEQNFVNYIYYSQIQFITRSPWYGTNMLLYILLMYYSSGAWEADAACPNLNSQPSHVPRNTNVLILTCKIIPQVFVPNVCPAQSLVGSLLFLFSQSLILTFRGKWMFNLSSKDALISLLYRLLVLNGKH